MQQEEAPINSHGAATLGRGRTGEKEDQMSKSRIHASEFPGGGLRAFRIVMLAVLGLALAAPAFATGNGAPSGSHYNLNIIGHNNCPGDDLKGTNRHVIDVFLNFHDGSQNGQTATTLDKTNKIFLAQGDFQVLDGNACDGDGAKFQLPANPFSCPADDPACLNTDPTFQNYTVWVRALGTPGGHATITTCENDLTTLEIVCSMENVLLVRNTGKSRFTNVTKELTTVCLNTD